MNRQNWIRKKNRIKNKLNKSNNQYKLVVFRSNKHIYGQVLDTDKGITVFSSSSLDKELNKDLCERIKNKKIDLENHFLQQHLIKTTMAKLSIDQPKYSGYLKALEDNYPKD